MSQIIVIILVTGILTFSIRFSFIALAGHIEMPTVLQQALRFVPVAVLTAPVIPALSFQSGTLNLSLGNERLLSGIITAIVAKYSKNVLLTIVIGMGTLWLLQWAGV